MHKKEKAMNEATISAQAAKQQEASAGSIFRQYSSRLMGFIRKRVSSLEDAEDILQDVFLQVVNGINWLQPNDQLSGWLFTVARNSITDSYRKKKAVSVSFAEADDEEGDEGLDEIREILLATPDGPESEYLRQLVWQELGKALAELPKEQRDVFEATELNGVPFKELSEISGLPVNTLISRKRYAVLHLRKRMKVLYKELTEY